MGTPTQHATLSASGSSRWLNCTAAPRFETNFPDETASVYAQEGTLAHKFCELTAQYNFNLITKRKRTSEIKKLQKDPLYQEEMIKTSDFYAQYLFEKSLTFSQKPYTAQEVRVDFSDYVPEGFGTCDCIMIGADTLHITDYKHGKGVKVSAEGNSQMRLYALGALKKYSPIFGDSIKKVSMAIVQPRITEDISEEVLTVEQLKEWGAWVKPIAQKAYYGMGEFKAGTWCRFCKGRAVCKARAENYTALEDFKEALIEGQMSSEQAINYQRAEDFGAEVPGMLSDEEVADLLIRAESLVLWYNDLKAYALEAILEGKSIPGWKAVEGRSDRAFSDKEKVLEALKEAGYEEEKLYKPKELLTLSALEKLVGKKKFSELLGEWVVKPQGKPTLVPESDKRKPYNAAVADFSGVGEHGQIGNKD